MSSKIWNMGEAVLVFGHVECVKYCKQHYIKQKQFKYHEVGWAIIFNTQGQVKRAIQHLENKFQFDEIENWE